MERDLDHTAFPPPEHTHGKGCVWRGSNLPDGRSPNRARVWWNLTVMSTPTTSCGTSISHHLRAIKGILECMSFDARYV